MSLPYPHEENLEVPVSMFLDILRDPEIIRPVMSKPSVKNYVENNSVLVSHMMRDKQISKNIMELEDEMWSRYTAIAFNVLQTPPARCSPNTPPFAGHQTIDGPTRQDSEQDVKLDATLSRSGANRTGDQYRTEIPCLNEHQFRTDITSKTRQGKATTKVGEVETSARHLLNIKSESEANSALTELQKLTLNDDKSAGKVNIGASSLYGDSTTLVGSVHSNTTNHQYGGNVAHVGHGIAISGSSRIMGDVTYQSQSHRGSNQKFEPQVDHQPRYAHQPRFPDHYNTAFHPGVIPLPYQRLQDPSRHPAAPQKRPNTEPSSSPLNPLPKQSENSPSRVPVTSPQNQPDNRQTRKPACSPVNPPQDQLGLQSSNRPFNPPQNQQMPTFLESRPLSSPQNATISAGALSKRGAAKVDAKNINISVEDPGQPVKFLAESEEKDATLTIGTMTITTKLPQENIKNYHIDKVVGSLYVDSKINSTITGCEGADIQIAGTSVKLEDTDK